MDSVTETIARYVQTESFERLPQSVVEKTKAVILDTFGCTFGGTVTKEAEILMGLAEGMGGVSESTIFGLKNKFPCTVASFVNSQNANILDYDETYLSVGHPAALAVFSALALGERENASGKDLLTSIVCGYEVSTRLGIAILPSEKRRQQVWPYGTWHTFSAAAAACKILGLSLKEIRDAFGIAGAAAPVPSTKRVLSLPSSMIKNSNAWATRLGVEAALLAREGFTGIADVLDGDDGFWVIAGSDRCDWKIMREGLGSEYNILDTSYKPWSTCRWIHPILTALEEILSQERIKVDDIEKITCKSFNLVSSYPYDNQEPSSMEDAWWSVPWAVAMQILGYKSGPEWYTEERFKDKQVQSIARRTIVEHDEEADKTFPDETPAEVTLDTKTSKFTSRVKYPKGDPQHPMNNEELREKFLYLSSFVLSSEKAILLEKAVNSLENMPDLNDLTGILVPE